MTHSSLTEYYKKGMATRITACWWQSFPSVSILSPRRSRTFMATAFYASNVPSAKARDSESGFSKIDREARLLYREFYESESYRKYRLRQPKPSDRNKDQKWPDHLEQAFFRAIVTWLPVGRKKQKDSTDTQRGRNELISNCLERWAGEHRDRKQVSSHIQVLKPFVKHNPRIMRYLSNPRKARQNVPNAGHVQHTRDQGGVMLLPPNGNSLPPPLSTLGSNAPPCIISTSVEPFDFEMFVRDPRGEPPTHLHTFTKFPRHARQATVGLPNIRGWQRMFPSLAVAHDKETLDCDVVYAEASLELMTSPLPEGAELGIQFELSGNDGVDLDLFDFSCLTLFYENGNHVHTDINVDTIGYDRHGTKRLHTVPFGSRFWAQKFVELATPLWTARKRAADWSATQEPDQALETSVQRIESHVRESIKGLSAVLELYAIPKDRGEAVGHQRVLIVCWKFSQTRPGEHGITKWRSLTVPTQEPADDVVPRGTFNPLLFDFNNATMEPASQPFEQPTLLPAIELGSISSMGLTGMPSGARTPLLGTNLDPDDTVDFTAGHIDISMEPAVSLDDLNGTPAHLASTHLALGRVDPYARTWPEYGTAFYNQGGFPTPQQGSYGNHAADFPTTQPESYQAQPEDLQSQQSDGYYLSQQSDSYHTSQRSDSFQSQPSLYQSQPHGYNFPYRVRETEGFEGSAVESPVECKWP
ncbi:hypothetical protein B0A49_05814 [Cryomyces minteri]|uniref:TEA domain-containing protein n=1 Tax=Cryomyces minteri TaxID=331657 RepID=A0A4U0WTR0_9PEZI|nr:hypothetical protein B0A49_05814 [Cryomyces minteri]